MGFYLIIIITICEDEPEILCDNYLVEINNHNKTPLIFKHSFILVIFNSLEEIAWKFQTTDRISSVHWQSNMNANFQFRPSIM